MLAYVYRLLVLMNRNVAVGAGRARLRVLAEHLPRAPQVRRAQAGVRCGERNVSNSVDWGGGGGCTNDPLPSHLFQCPHSQGLGLGGYTARPRAFFASSSLPPGSLEAVRRLRRPVPVPTCTG